MVERSTLSAAQDMARWSGISVNRALIKGNLTDVLLTGRTDKHCTS
jgi:hypothetical protein